MMISIVKRTQFITLAILAILYFIAWQLQSTLLLSWDVSWLLHVTQHFIAGGAYTHAFFELNPPMIVYFYLPPVWITKVFGMSIIAALRAYMLIWISASLAVAYRIFQQLFPAQHTTERYVFIVSLAIVYLLFPLYEFGQREHLIILLIMPYLLLVAARLQGCVITTRLAVLVGVLAGAGFAIKPYYLITAVLLESYCLIRTREIFYWVRLETLTLLFVLLNYVTSIFFWQRDYLDVMIPLAARNYYHGLGLSGWGILFTPAVWFSVLSVVFSSVATRKSILTTILAITVVSFLGVYFAQRVNWYYHVLPAFSAAFLLAVVGMQAFVRQFVTQRQDVGFALLLGAVIFALPVYSLVTVYRWSLEYKTISLPLIAYLKKQASQQSLYEFATTTVQTFPLVDYAGTIPVGRMGSFGWILPGLLDRHDADVDQDEKALVNIVVTDLNTQKPQWVFVDVQADKPYLHGKSFDYLVYFSRYAEFRAAWTSYRYVTTLDEPLAYRFQVYQRIDQ